jgi:CubicO group peptidase (beta-lactamase class C family)
MLQQLVSNHGIRGIVVGLLDEAGTRRVFAHGNAGPQTLSLDAESVFEIGSMTKVFTGILLEDTVRRGEVELADSVRILAFAAANLSLEDTDLTLAIRLSHRGLRGPSALPRGIQPFWGWISRHGAQWSC